MKNVGSALPVIWKPLPCVPLIRMKTDLGPLKSHTFGAVNKRVISCLSGTPVNPSSLAHSTLADDFSSNSNLKGIKDSHVSLRVIGEYFTSNLLSVSDDWFMTRSNISTKDEIV